MTSPYLIFRARQTLYSPRNRRFDRDFPSNIQIQKAESHGEPTLPETPNHDVDMSATIVSASTSTFPTFGHLSLCVLPQDKASLEAPILPSPIVTSPYSSTSTCPYLDSPSSPSFPVLEPVLESLLEPVPTPIQEPILKPRVEKNLSLPNFGNDYSNAFVKQGKLPQNWIRNVEAPLNGYPKLQLLHDIKQRHNAPYAQPAVGIPTDNSIWTAAGTATNPLPEKIEEIAAEGNQFDVIMVHGCLEDWSSQTFAELRIDLVAARPSLLFFWVPSNRIDEARALMEKWGFRRGEDISYMVDSLDSVHAPQQRGWNRQSSLFVPTTWHCLMGLRGTLRRSTDTDLINCNVDTDVIIEKPGQRANVVPEQIYQLVENFTSMRRKLHIIPSKTPEHLPVRLRPGWIMMGPSVLPRGKIAPEHFRSRSLVPVHSEVDNLRPQTPPTRQSAAK